MELLESAPAARVQRAFAFVDVCGFSEVADQRGDGAALRLLSEFRSHVRDACSHYGVRVGKWLGDGAMLVGVDPTQLVAATVTIVGEDAAQRPPVRGGMTVGGVLVFEGDDYIGRTVNLAARLCERAGPGQLLVESSAVCYVPPSLEVQHRRPASVHGFQAPIEVCTVTIATHCGPEDARRMICSPHAAASSSPLDGR